MLSSIKIKSIKKIKHSSKRYDIEVFKNHCFFANGILVHNSSCTIYCKNVNGEWVTGITSRTMDLKIDKVNKYTTIVNKYGIIDKLKEFCNTHNVNLALRGEIYGNGIQNMKHNPHCNKPLSFALFSVLNLDTLKYEGIDSPMYYERIAEQLNIETVPMVEKGVELTPALIKKYDEDLTKINDQPFEGVVIKMVNGSFKVINKDYDSKK